MADEQHAAVSDQEQRAAASDQEAAKKAGANKKKREKAKAKKAAAKLGTICEQAAAADVMTRENGRVGAWWSVYQSAFEAEHEWMEARKQRTSRSMGPDAGDTMFSLVFNAEDPTCFTRLSFFARTSGEADPCGWATVDVDHDPGKVCHLRMLLVAPARQRQGVGLALLRFVVAQFETRQLGLKYCKLHDYHALYSQVGFKRIGSDDHFVYMALKRSPDGRREFLER